MFPYHHALKFSLCDYLPSRISMTRDYVKSWMFVEWMNQPCMTLSMFLNSSPIIIFWAIYHLSPPQAENFSAHVPFSKVEIFFQYWDLNSGLSPWATPPALFYEGFFEIGSRRTICPGLALNCNPPDLCLLSSKDYRLGHQRPAKSRDSYCPRPNALLSFALKS
jgi:hypothetical protein